MISIKQGETITLKMAVTKRGNYSQNTQFSVYGVPFGVSVTLSPTETSNANNLELRAVMKAESYATIGSYSVTFSGVPEPKEPQVIQLDVISPQAPATNYTADFTATKIVNGADFGTPGGYNFVGSLYAGDRYEQAVSYEWNFGDGSNLAPSQDDSALHNYTTAGTYVVTLNVLTTGGQTVTKSKQVNVTISSATTTQAPAPAKQHVSVTGATSVGLHPDGNYVYYTTMKPYTNSSGEFLLGVTIPNRVGLSSSETLFTSSTVNDVPVSGGSTINNYNSTGMTVRGTRSNGSGYSSSSNQGSLSLYLSRDIASSQGIYYDYRNSFYIPTAVAIKFTPNDNRFYPFYVVVYSNHNRPPVEE